MNSIRHSFMDIFKTTFIDGQEEVQLQRIIIPIIQRDYAQGRDDPEIARIRSRFLDSLCEAGISSLFQSATSLFYQYSLSYRWALSPLSANESRQNQNRFRRLKLVV